MLKVILRIKDNSLNGEEVNFEARFSDNVELIEVKKWITNIMGDGDELLNTRIEQVN